MTNENGVICHYIAVCLLQDFTGEDSWSSWAWSLGSALLPVYWEDEENTISAQHYRLNKTLHMGLYVEMATWTFKVRIFIPCTSMRTNKFVVAFIAKIELM